MPVLHDGSEVSTEQQMDHLWQLYISSEAEEGTPRVTLGSQVHVKHSDIFVCVYSTHI